MTRRLPLDETLTRYATSDETRAERARCLRALLRRMKQALLRTKRSRVPLQARSDVGGGRPRLRLPFVAPLPHRQGGGTGGQHGTLRSRPGGGQVIEEDGER